MPLNLTIYVDVLFLLNMIVDYIVLSSSALISGRETVKWRMLLGAAAGALFLQRNYIFPSAAAA